VLRKHNLRKFEIVVRGGENKELKIPEVGEKYCFSQKKLTIEEFEKFNAQIVRKGSWF